MKLRDLARNSRAPTTFLPAIRVFLTRFANIETARRTRRSYESALVSTSILCRLISLY